MNKSLFQKTLVLMTIVVLFVSMSVAPVSSLSIDQVSSKVDEDIEDDIFFNSTPHSVDDIGINKMFSEREDFDKDLYERYPWRYDEYLRNDSDYLYDDPFLDCPNYEELNDIYSQRFNDEYVKNHTVKNRSPTPKPNFADGKTWYVDDDGGPGIDFTRIQDAIDAADDGDTVYAYSGFYQENIVIDKSIILEGEDRNTTVIDGDNRGHVVNISADWVNISGFKIQNGSNYGQDGVHLHSNFCVIYRNTIYNNYIGISIEQSSNNNVKRNNIEDNAYGVYFYQDSNHNQISNNVISGSFGIACDDSNNNEIIANSFHNSGLAVRRSYQNLVYENTVNGKPLVYLEDKYNKVIKNAGQVILICCKNIIIRNQELNNTTIGIELWESRECIIENNTVNNNIFGIFHWYSDNNIISNNCISNNFYKGIEISISNFNNIKNNEIILNTRPASYGAGISFSDSNNNTIQDNNISKNEHDGIWVTYSKNNFFINNIINHNKNYGIYLQDISHSCILKNNVNNNYHDGIRINNHVDKDISKNIINDNIISSNNGYCLYGRRCIDSIISGNIIINNTDGMKLEYNEFNTISDNIFVNDGLIIEMYSEHNSVLNNTVNGKPLIYLEGESDKIIDDAGQVILVNCDNITVQNQYISNTTRGIHLISTCNSSILGNIIDSNNDAGVHLEDLSCHNIISSNTIMNNRGNGIFLLSRSCYNKIRNNHCISNNKNGVRLSDSHNTITNCTISLNFQDGIMVDDSYNIVTNCSISSNFQYGIRIEDSSSNILSNCTIENHRTVSGSSGLSLVNSDNTLIENCCISNNKNAGLEIDLLSTGTNITGCLLTHNSWGIDLTSSSFNRIEKCTIANNIYGGIREGQSNTIIRNNFINNLNHYIHGDWHDTNVFFRNYWSGHFTPLPYRVFNRNYDKFPRVIPYNYPTYNETLVGDSDSYSFDFVKSMVWNENYNDQNTRFLLTDKLSERLSSLFSKAADVLNQDQWGLVNSWRDMR